MDTADTLKERFKLTDENLDCVIDKSELLSLGGLFGQWQTYASTPGLGLSDIEIQTIHLDPNLVNNRIKLVEAFKIWQNKNPLQATFRNLIDIVLELHQVDVAIKISQFLENKLSTAISTGVSIDESYSRPQTPTSTECNRSMDSVDLKFSKDFDCEELVLWLEQNEVSGPTLQLIREQEINGESFLTLPTDKNELAKELDSLTIGAKSTLNKLINEAERGVSIDESNSRPQTPTSTECMDSGIAMAASDRIAVAEGIDPKQLDQPCSRELLFRISKLLPNWMEFADLLHITRQEINEINSDPEYTYLSKSYRMLQMWYDKFIYTERCHYRALIEASRELGHGTVAGGICKIIKGVSIDESNSRPQTPTSTECMDSENPPSTAHVTVENPPSTAHVTVENPPSTAHVTVENPPSTAHFIVSNIPPTAIVTVENSPSTAHVTVENIPPGPASDVYTEKDFECLSCDNVLELVNNDTILDGDDLAEILGSLEKESANWNLICTKLHVSSNTIQGLATSNKTNEVRLSDALTEWLKLNYNFQEHGKPTWRKVAESVFTVNMKLFLDIARQHSK